MSESHAIILVLTFWEICLWPELFSQPRFKLQGKGGSISITQELTNEQTEILMSNFGFIGVSNAY